jgi:hypothetical protein
MLQEGRLWWRSEEGFMRAKLGDLSGHADEDQARGRGVGQRGTGGKYLLSRLLTSEGEGQETPRCFGLA